VPLDIVSVMLSPEMRAISSIVWRFSITTNRQGWLFSWEGARPATSRRSLWCPAETGSGRNAPFVVLRRRMASSRSMWSRPIGGLERADEARDEERGGGQRDERMPYPSSAGPRDRGQRHRGRHQRPSGSTALSPRPAPPDGAGGCRRARARRHVQRVVQPPKA